VSAPGTSMSVGVAETTLTCIAGLQQVMVGHWLSSHRVRLKPPRS
jgi:hypothetical protein